MTSNRPQTCRAPIVAALAMCLVSSTVGCAKKNDSAMRVMACGFAMQVHYALKEG